MPEQDDIPGIRYAVMLALSQTNLAKMLGVSDTAVSTWLRQGYVPRKRVKQIHALFPKIPQSRLCNPAFLEMTAQEENLEK